MGQNDLKEDGNMDFGYRSFGGGGLVTQLCPILVTPWTVACQSPLSMEFPRQEYWSGLPFCYSRGTSRLRDGIEPTSLASPALTGRLFTTSATWKTLDQGLGSHT